MISHLAPPESNPQVSLPSGLMPESLDALVRVFKLLSDETRLRILLFLRDEHELHVRALCHRLGQSQPAVSHHLAMLREEGLIECRRQGKHNFYRLAAPHLAEFLERLVESAGHSGQCVAFGELVGQGEEVSWASGPRP